MMYSKKTLDNIIKRLAKSIAIACEKAEKQELHVHISKGNSKIGRVHNFSLAPIFTCENCKECKHFCYDLKACLIYPQVSTARAENTVLIKGYRDKAFQEIDEYVSRRRVHKFFRWHVAGDITDLDYFVRIVQIAKKHSEWTFWTYTKNYRIVNEYCDMYGKESIPQNLSVMFSVWNGLPMDNRHNFPTFTCIQEGMKIPEKEYHCPGNCDICKTNHRGCIARESAYCFEH